MSEFFHKELISASGATTRVDLSRLSQLATGDLTTTPLQRKTK